MDIDLLIEMFLIVSLISILISIYFQNKKIDTLYGLHENGKLMIEANIKAIEAHFEAFEIVRMDRDSLATALLDHLRIQHGITIEDLENAAKEDKGEN